LGGKGSVGGGEEGGRREVGKREEEGGGRREEGGMGEGRGEGDGEHRQEDLLLAVGRAKGVWWEGTEFEGSRRHGEKCGFEGLMAR